MKYIINGNEEKISIFDYYKAKRINKHINKAKQLIKMYNIEKIIDAEFECHTTISLFVIMRYKAIDKVKPYDIYFIKHNSHYIFNGTFNESDFIAKVIMPTIKSCRE